MGLAYSLMYFSFLEGNKYLMCIYRGDKMKTALLFLLGAWFASCTNIETFFLNNNLDLRLVVYQANLIWYFLHAKLIIISWWARRCQLHFAWKKIWKRFFSFIFLAYFISMGNSLKNVQPISFSCTACYSLLNIWAKSFII